MNDLEMPPESIHAAEASDALAVLADEAVLPLPSTPERMEPSHDDIACRAFEIYNRKGRAKGQCILNWQQAERELQNQSASPNPRDIHNIAPTEPARKSFVGNLLSIRSGRRSARGTTPPSQLASHETH